MANIDGKINMIIEKDKAKTKIEFDNKKRVVSILNEIRKYMLEFYVHNNNIFKLIEKYRPQK